MLEIVQLLWEKIFEICKVDVFVPVYNQVFIVIYMMNWSLILEFTKSKLLINIQLESKLKEITKSFSKTFIILQNEKLPSQLKEHNSYQAQNRKELM